MNATTELTDAHLTVDATTLWEVTTVNATTATSAMASFVKTEMNVTMQAAALTTLAAQIFLAASNATVTLVLSEKTVIALTPTNACTMSVALIRTAQTPLDPTTALVTPGTVEMPSRMMVAVMSTNVRPILLVK